MAPPLPGAGAALFERLFGRPPETDAEASRLRTLFGLLGTTLDRRGPEYLDALAVYLTQLLNIDLCLISRVGDGGIAHPIAQAQRGESQSPCAYPLANTPCEYVVQGSPFVVQDGLADAFPLDEIVVEAGYRSYYGVPLWGESDEVIGLICLLDTEPLPDAELAEQVVGMFAQRAATELARILDKREAEAKESILQSFAREFPGWVCAYESDGDGANRKIIFSSPGGATLLGPRNIEKLLHDASHYNSLLHPEERSRVEQLYREARNARASYESEYRMRHDDGTYRRVGTVGRFVSLPDGRVSGHALMLDREELHRLREDHLQTLDALRTLVGAIPDAVLMQDGKGRVQFANRAAETLFGIPVQTMQGATFEEIAAQHPEYAELFRRAQRNTDAAFASKQPVETSVQRSLPREDRLRDLEVRRVPLTDRLGEPQALVTVVRDVTSAVEAQRQKEELRRVEARAARLNALSRLVDGIAHEFENQLTAVLGYGELGAARLRQSSASSEDLAPALRAFERIQDAAQTASALARNLLAYAGSSPNRAESARLIPSLQQLIPQLEREVAPDHQLQVEWDDALGAAAIPLPAADLATLLEQLIRNAAEASEVGDGVQLRVRPCQLADDADGVQLEVIDAGHGVPEHLPERIFDPLFSTRERHSRRRGLGLAVASNLVLRAGGRIELLRSDHTGTTVAVTLPLVPAEADAAQEATRPAPHILIVEDDQGTRSLLEEVLRAGGYRVSVCADTTSAETVAAEQTPDLLLADVHLPDGLGTDLLTHLRQRQPALRALFCSGLPEDHLELRGIRLPEGLPLLQKPFRPTALLTAVRDALSTRPRPTLAP